jgi:hypothetical protein
MIGCLAIVNLAALSTAFLVAGWRGVLALFIVELGVSAIAGALILVTVTSAEDHERAEVYRRWDEWARDRARRRER